MSPNTFYERKGPFWLKELIKNDNSKIKVFDIKTLDNASSADLTFFDSPKYKLNAENTKARVCLTTEKLKKHLPANCHKIIVKNVLFELAKIAKKFYPSADIDFPDKNLKKPEVFTHVLSFSAFQLPAKINQKSCQSGLEIDQKMIRSWDVNTYPLRAEQIRVSVQSCSTDTC